MIKITKKELDSIREAMCNSLKYKLGIPVSDKEKPRIDEIVDDLQKLLARAGEV